MSLSDVDRLLLQRCLDRDPRAWRDFVDRFIGLVVHVVHRTTQGRGIPMDEATRDDLVAEVFLVLLRHDMSALRRFRRQCSLATYLTVVARRVVVRRLIQWDRQPSAPAGTTEAQRTNGHAATLDPASIADRQAEAMVARIDSAEHVEALLSRLDPREASVVRMYHLEGKSYEEIGRAVGMNENSIGPLLHRARGKMNDAS